MSIGGKIVYLFNIISLKYDKPFQICVLNSRQAIIKNIMVTEIEDSTKALLLRHKIFLSISIKYKCTQYTAHVYTDQFSTYTLLYSQTI